MKQSVLFALAFSLFLAACMPAVSTGNTVASSHVPQKTCAVEGLSCSITPSGPGTLTFSLQNNGRTDFYDVSVALQSTDCQAPAVSLGRLPASARSPATFRCASAPPAVYAGTFTLSYRLGKDAAVETATGTFSYR